MSLPEVKALMVVVSAMTGATSSSEPSFDPAARPLVAGDHRPIPKYDGRPASSPTPAEVFIWAPRAILLPAHVVLEYGVRRPTVALITTAEEHYVVQRALSLFTWNQGTGRAFPTLSLRTDATALVGVDVAIDQAGSSDNAFRLRASGRNARALGARVEDRLEIFDNRAGRLTLAAGYRRADDNVYHGVGPGSLESWRAYYLSDVADAGVNVDGRLGGLSRGHAGLSYSRTSLAESERGEVGGSGLFSQDGQTGGVIARLGGHYQLVKVHGAVAFDSRSAFRPATPGSGVRLQGDADFAIDPSDAALRFVRWGGALAGIVNLTGYEHLLIAQLTAEFLEKAGPRPVPFTEAVKLGGAQIMQGFRPGRLRGESAISAGVHYRYPFWILMDAELTSTVGNAFLGHLRGFGPARLLWSNAVSLKTNFSRDTAVGVTVAIGSTRFDQGHFRVADSVQYLLGVGQGF